MIAHERLRIEVLRYVGTARILGVITMTTRAELPPDASEQLLEAFKALANPVRLQVLQWLREPLSHFPVDQETAERVGVCVSHIQAKTGLAQSTVSAYMASLHRAGLVRATRVGKWTHYQRDERHIALLVDLLGRSL
jgi:ArsR family transcriptional regulator